MFVSYEGNLVDPLTSRHHENSGWLKNLKTVTLEKNKSFVGKMLEKVTPYTFEDFIDRTSKSRDFDELFAHLSQAVKTQGFDRIIFSVARDSELPDEYNQIGLAQNYPSDWQRYYTEKKYERIDPVLKYAAISDLPFTWKALEKKFSLSNKQTKFMREGEEAKLFNGVGIPIKIGAGDFAGIALATTEKIDACNTNLDLLNAYCHQFYLSFKRIYKKDTHINNLPVLSDKQEAILIHVAAGKTDDEIASVLNISRNTVDTHIRHIFEKLEAKNRVVAVVKAISHGLIRI